MAFLSEVETDSRKKTRQNKNQKPARAALESPVKPAMHAPLCIKRM
jgi:hypothetical protein